MQHRYRQRSAFTRPWNFFESLFEGLELNDWRQFVADRAGSKKPPSDFGAGFYFCPGPWNSPICLTKNSIAPYFNATYGKKLADWTIDHSIRWCVIKDASTKIVDVLCKNYQKKIDMINWVRAKELCVGKNAQLRCSECDRVGAGLHNDAQMLEEVIPQSERNIYVFMRTENFLKWTRKW